ncbi:carbohydrate ABC transporter substrate-binding protein [Bacillus sp. FJAT-49732]|uniref:Carbohydrate ABC transporter substrate-binding protein n=1 Tax=Lederbergia citrisecunda TaxID=2833583 RepID=A0A942TRY4_9BACI|nr:ABC transporter substrate-binding protein [Lederbergia citrisecunda]MBS4201822.1 carbohydrate ABC transporter substrate-binding protein [Lederbergia citrisecunda]
MKKAFSLISIILLMSMVLLAACGGKNSKAGDKIVIFQSKVEITDQLKALAKDYEKEKGVKVEIWETTGDDYYQQLKTKLSSKQGPTIFTLGGQTEGEQLKSYEYDLSNQDFMKNVAPEKELVIDGKKVGLPYGIEGYGLVYNKSLVKAENVKDYDSFNKTLKDLKAEGVNGLGLSQESYFLIAHILNTPFALLDDPEAFIEKLNKGEVKMADTKEFQEFAKFMESIRAESYNPLEYNYDKQIGDFATGKTAMIHQGNWAYGMFKDYGDLGFDMGMLPLPLMGNDKISVGVPSYWAVNADADQKEIDAALDFLNWFTTSETGQHYIVDEFGFIPAMTNIEAKNLDPLSKDLLQASNSGKSIPWTFNLWPAGIVDADLAPATQEFFINKDMTGQQFIESLDAAWANATK